MTLPKILRQPSTKVKSYNKKSEVSLLIDPYSENLPIRDISIDQEFDIIKTLHEGFFSKIHLVRRRNSETKERLAIKGISHQNVEDFYRELNYNYFLSPHPNVVTCYNVSIEWDDLLVFPMEYAISNLSKFISQEACMSETSVKCVAKQVASALDFIHSLKLVHRDIQMENVLVFKPDLSQIKLCDFGATRPEKSLVACLKQESYKEIFQLPPEICHLVKGESYYVHRSSDVWQLGMLIYLMLSNGTEPWQSADISDPIFAEWVHWLHRKNLRVPDSFQIFTPRLLRLFKRLFEPKPKKRCDAKEILKYLEDDWILKLYRGSSFRRGVLERQASSSTNRSRSSGTARSRNSSLKRKSFRNSTKSSSLRHIPVNGIEIGTVKESSTGPGDSCGKLSGSGRDKLSEIDKDFLKERVGQWILESASVTPNSLKVPGAQA